MCKQIYEIRTTVLVNVVSMLSLPPFAGVCRIAEHRPVAVDILLQFGARHRLLTGTGTVFHVMRMQTDAVIRVDELQHGTARDVLVFGSYIAFGGGGGMRLKNITYQTPSAPRKPINVEHVLIKAHTRKRKLLFGWILL